MSAVYIAASSREPIRVRAAQRALRDLGHSLTLDWLTVIDAVVAQGIAERDLPDQQALTHAQADLDAIRAADVVWFLAPVEPTRGAWVELGFAIGIGKAIVISGAQARQSIFTRLACAIVDRDADALIEIGALR